MRGWVDIDSPDPLIPLPIGWENTERIASLYSYRRNQLAYPGLPYRFHKSAAYRPQDDSSGLTIHSHRFDCNWLDLTCLCKSSVFTAFELLGAVCSCASFYRCSIQVYPSKSIKIRAIPNQTPTTTKREDCYAIRAWSISSTLTQEAPKPMAIQLNYNYYLSFHSYRV